MRNVILFVLVLLANKLFAQYPPFDTLKYTDVVVYEYEGSEREGQCLIVENNKLAKSTKKVKLTTDQIASFVKIVGSESTYGEDKAFCFIPRMGIVFYHHNEIVAHISICLECNYLRSSIDIPAKEVEKIQIDDYEYSAEGFSELGQSFLYDFCVELGFKNCKSPTE